MSLKIYWKDVTFAVYYFMIYICQEIETVSLQQLLIHYIQNQSTLSLLLYNQIFKSFRSCYKILKFYPGIDNIVNHVLVYESHLTLDLLSLRFKDS